MENTQEMINAKFFFFRFVTFQARQNCFAVQPNVIKKSWTTSNIALAIKDDNRICPEEVPTFKSRDLIREYMLKSRVPEILKPMQSHRHSPPYITSAMTSEMNFAYKHPLVIAEELNNFGAGETMAFDNSSIIVPKPIGHAKRVSQDERPHLIGKVTPSIAKTWEQLSSAMNSSIGSHTEEDDKQSYVLFVRKPFNFQPSGEFAVNKIQHDDEFFDSIDNDLRPDADEFEEEESGTEAGELMAEDLDSLEMRCNDVILWSIES